MIYLKTEMSLKLLILITFSILVLPLDSFAQKNYLNDPTTYTIQPSTPTLLNLTSNLTIQENINHTFEGRVTTNFFDYDVAYVVGDKSAFLLYLRFNGQVGNNDQIQNISCTNGQVSTIFTGSSSATEFNNFHNFTVFFDAPTNTAKIFIDWQEVASTAVCTNFNDVSSINFTSGLSGEIKNNLVLANNLKPTLIGNISNITWPEDTSFSFNISGNFSDPNNDTLTYNVSYNVENITITINSTTGIVNLTPSPNFFGVRNVTFFANDSENITYSNNVTLNVTPVNDIPLIFNLTLNNTDFLNRTNGSLVVGRTFSDIDGDIENGTEILWYINGTEKEESRNLTLINSTNTTKNQNWSVSVRVFDGTTFSDWINSSNITIADALPFFSPSLGRIQAERNEILVYDVNYTDLDNDNMNFYDNSSFFNITNDGIINFTPQDVGNTSVNITIGRDLNVSETLTIEVSDTRAPIITSIGTLNAGSNPVIVTLSATTDETAECRFSTSDLNFTNMTTIFSTNSTSHSNSISYSSDSLGTYYVRCVDNYSNTMNFSNSTAFNADAQEPSSNSGGSSSSSSSSSGGGGSGNFICEFDWRCGEWSECLGGKQERKCILVQVPVFTLNDKCPQNILPEQSRDCEVPAAVKETCDDKIRNQNEEEVDCGGICKPCAIEEAGNEKTQESPNLITGAVVGGPKEFDYNNIWLLIAVILAASSLLLYAKYGHRKLFKKEQLSEKEMKKLNEMLGYEMFKK